MLPFEIGKPFDFGAERESLRVLYRTGDFADIRVTALPADGGLGVNFVVRRNFYNNVVRVGGLKEPPSEAAALAAMRLSLGDPFRESSLREALARLKDTLRNEGLYQADVKWSSHAARRHAANGCASDCAARPACGSWQFQCEEQHALQGCRADRSLEGKAEQTADVGASDPGLAATEEVSGQSRLPGRGHI